MDKNCSINDPNPNDVSHVLNCICSLDTKKKTINFFFPFFRQVRNVSRDECKGISAISLEDVKKKAAKRFNLSDLPKIHLDADGTEVDDEDYFQTLDRDTELVAVFEGEKWIDVSILHTCY